MTRKICIVRTDTRYLNEGDGLQSIIEHTDWSEVSEEEYTALKGMQYRYDYHVIERVEVKTFLPKMVSEFQAQLKKAEADRLKLENERKRKLEEKKIKRLAKTKEEEVRLLKALMEKYGVQNN